MTKEELRDGLKAGKTPDSLLVFCPGQDCWIFKTMVYAPGGQIIYVPDVELNDIHPHKVLTDPEEINEVVGCCYTGDDFLELVDGDIEKARELFDYVDWQHPISALPELEMCWEEDEETEGT